jgi:hypothetical protein
MRLFLNDYYRRKPDRLLERDGEILTMEKGGEFNYEFLSIDLHNIEIESLQKQNSKMRECLEESLIYIGIDSSSKNLLDRARALLKDLDNEE